MKAELIQKEAAKLTAGIEDWELEEDLQDAFIEGALWAEKTIIDKACDWLYEYNRKQTDKMFGTVHTADVTINVAEFRKAMEGGEE